ncbi:MAG: 50S ribosomal protein L4 [bacterium]|nr:50S ribosomal protein L4 [bacterium]
MITTDILDHEGKISGKVNLPEDFFGAEVNDNLLTQAVRVYLSNQRKAHAKTKTRSEVLRTTAKWFRQKGTGHARHGSRSAPIFVGGGVAHGPRGTQNYEKKMSKAMRIKALAGALTTKYKSKEVTVINGLDKIEGKTKELIKILAGIKTGKAKKFLLVLPKKMDLITRAGGNIPGLTIRPVNLLTAYEVLNSDHLLILKEAIDKLKKE